MVSELKSGLAIFDQLIECAKLLVSRAAAGIAWPTSSQTSNSYPI